MPLIITGAHNSCAYHHIACHDLTTDRLANKVNTDKAQKQQLVYDNGVYDVPQQHAVPPVETATRPPNPPTSSHPAGQSAGVKE
jgi:hypothetical protein